MIPKDEIEKWFSKIIDLDKKYLDILFNTPTEGKKRDIHGFQNEKLINTIVNTIAKYHKLSFKSLKGEKEDKKYLTNNFGKISVSIDRHIYINNEFKCVIESKHYLDASMAKRCLFEVQNLKLLFPKIKSIIVQFEEGLGEDVLNFIKNI